MTLTGIDPYAYLRDILTRLPKMTNWELEKVDLTPASWAREQRELSEQTRQVASAA